MKTDCVLCEAGTENNRCYLDDRKLVLLACRQHRSAFVMIGVLIFSTTNQNI
jgi:hypothetical protein